MQVRAMAFRAFLFKQNGFCEPLRYLFGQIANGYGSPTTPKHPRTNNRV